LNIAIGASKNVKNEYPNREISVGAIGVYIEVVANGNNPNIATKNIPNVKNFLALFLLCRFIPDFNFLGLDFRLTFVT